jgi:hypothetical protein
MHSIHYLVVDVGGDFKGSNDFYEGLLSHKLDDEGNWFDWWVVGGRWEGSLHQELGIKPHLVSTGAPGAPDVGLVPNTNIAPVWDYRAYLPALLQRLHEGQEGALNDCRRYFTDASVGDQDESYVTKIRQQWQHILTAPLADLVTTPSFSMAGYYARNMQELCEGWWNRDSHFYDFHHCTASPLKLLSCLSDPVYEKDLKDLAVIGVDFHS